MTDLNQPQDERVVDEHTGTETTGHEWDGIQELNTPLPRWWLILFYVTIAWAFVYCLFMPTFPGLPGLRGHSERANVNQEIEMAATERSALASKLLSGLSLDEIEQDPELFQFVMAAGQSAFGDNCATCHGVGGQGFNGYPSLADDVWLWGGTLADIKATITHGIRGHSDETRISIMPAYGTDQLLQADQIRDLSVYVANFSDPQADHEAITRAQPIFEQNCAACHGNDAKGDRSMGAPDLTDSEWLYAGDVKSIRAQIYNGRNGVMPAWNERLDEATITALAVYVHALGGGEATEPLAGLRGSEASGGSTGGGASFSGGSDQE